MVREVRFSANDKCGTGRAIIEYSGCITSRPEPQPAESCTLPEEVPEFGMVLCQTSAQNYHTVRYDKVMHISNTGRTMTLCGKDVAERYPFMPIVKSVLMWRESGEYKLCAKCGAYVGM